MYKLCVKEIADVWFAVAFDDNEEILASNFSKLRKDVVSNILKSLPINSLFVEAVPKGAVLSILNKMYQIYNGRPVDGEFKLNMDNLPPFIKKVLLFTSRIPRGFVATYRGIAKALGNKSATRAVGQAEARNPFVLIVPCHRVVASNLRLLGYGGGLDVKRTILKKEAVRFMGDSVSRENLWIFS